MPTVFSNTLPKSNSFDEMFPNTLGLKSSSKSSPASAALSNKINPNASPFTGISLNTKPTSKMSTPVQQVKSANYTPQNAVTNTPQQIQSFVDNYQKTQQPVQNANQVTQQAPQQKEQEQTTYPGLISLLSRTSQQGSPVVQQSAQNLTQAASENQDIAKRAKEIADNAGQRISEIGGQGARGQAGYLTTGTSPVGEGNAAVLAQTTAAQQRAVAEGAGVQLKGTEQELSAKGQEQSGYNQAGGLGNTAQGLVQSGLNAAAGYAQPQLAGYNQQSFNPLTGQFGGGGSLNDAVQGVVNKLTAGQMSYNDAVNALSGYGQGGINALQNALPPGFNVAQSNALSTQQGLVGPSIQQATQTLNKLKGAVGNLQIPGQASGFTPLNSVANYLSTNLGFGKQQTAEVKGLVNEARNALQNALASSKGGTPTDYVGQSFAMLPDNPSTAEIDAAINILNSLGQIRQSIYGNPGQAGGTQGSQKTSGGTGGFAETW